VRVRVLVGQDGGSKLHVVCQLCVCVTGVCASVCVCVCVGGGSFSIMALGEVGAKCDMQSTMHTRPKLMHAGRQ